MPSPRIGVAVFVRRDNAILLGLRDGAHGHGTWGLPGGHLEHGESFNACARREVQEESGMTIDSISLGTVTNDIFPGENLHYVTVFLVADSRDGEVQIMEPHRCREWRWCSWNALPSPLFLPLQHAVDQGFDPFERNSFSPREKVGMRGPSP